MQRNMHSNRKNAQTVWFDVVVWETPRACDDRPMQQNALNITQFSGRYRD
jgi:hypothetical protein